MNQSFFILKNKAYNIGIKSSVISVLHSSPPMIAAARDKFQAENKTLEKRLQELSRQYFLLKAQYAQEQEVNAHNMRSLMQQGRDFQYELEEYRAFTLQQEIMPLHAAFLQELGHQMVQPLLENFVTHLVLLLDGTDIRFFFQ